MTPEEYERKLSSLPDSEYDEFEQKLGGEKSLREARVRQFAHSRKHEDQICFLLGLKTEDDKRTDAQITAANAAFESAAIAKDAANTAKSSRNIAFMAMLIATVMAVVVVMTYLNKVG